MIQDIKELEKFFEDSDPWHYESNPEDKKRKAILLSEIPQRKYDSVLDIGCGHGFVTRDLPGEKVLGVDISKNAIKQAKRSETRRVTFLQASLFELPNKLRNRTFDLIIITGVLYPQYIGNSYTLIYHIIDRLLADNGILVSVQIDEWYKGRFPFLLTRQYLYQYREYTHNLEVYIK